MYPKVCNIPMWKLTYFSHMQGHCRPLEVEFKYIFWNQCSMNIAHYVDVDTSLTEKEVEAMVDQTAMTLMVHDAVEKLKVIGQEAIDTQQKAAGAIKAHVEQLKTAFTQTKQSGNLKDLSDVVLNSQKVATDSVTVAKAAQVIKNLNYNLTVCDMAILKCLSSNDRLTFQVSGMASLCLYVLRSLLNNLQKLRVVHFTLLRNP